MILSGFHLQPYHTAFEILPFFFPKPLLLGQKGIRSAVAPKWLSKLHLQPSVVRNTDGFNLNLSAEDTDMECKISASWRHQSEEGTQLEALLSASLSGKLTTVPGMTAAAMAKDSSLKPLVRDKCIADRCYHGRNVSACASDSD